MNILFEIYQGMNFFAFADFDNPTFSTLVLLVLLVSLFIKISHSNIYPPSEP